MKISSKSSLFYLVVLTCLALLFFGYLKYASKNQSITASKPIIKVNNVKIYPEDLIFKKAVYEKCYQNIEKDKAEISAELINNALEEAVLKSKYNREPPESALAAKEQWIDKNTKAPEIWQCKKEVYRNNKAALYRNIIAPLLVNQKLHALFSLDNQIHKAERERIEKIFAQVKESPESIKNFQEYTAFNVSKHISAPEELAKAGAEFAPEPIIDKVLVHLKPGEFWPNIVEDDYSYKIVRLVSENNESYACDGVIVPKSSFDKWFREYAIANLKIEIYDSSLKESLKANYPNLWWWKLLK